MFTCTVREPAQKKAGVSEGTSGAAGLGPAPAQGPSADLLSSVGFGADWLSGF